MLSSSFILNNSYWWTSIVALASLSYKAFSAQQCELSYQEQHLLHPISNFQHLWVTIKHGRFVVICISVIFAGVDTAVLKLKSSYTTRTRASARRTFPRHVFLRSFAVTRLSANYRARGSDTNWRWEKPQEGGWWAKPQVYGSAEVVKKRVSFRQGVVLFDLLLIDD